MERIGEEDKGGGNVILGCWFNAWGLKPRVLCGFNNPALKRGVIENTTVVILIRLRRRRICWCIGFLTHQLAYSATGGIPSFGQAKERNTQKESKSKKPPSSSDHPSAPHSSPFYSQTSLY
jgi:hypothetical protein